MEKLRKRRTVTVCSMKFHTCRVEFLTTRGGREGGRARLSENFDVTKDERSRKVNSATASVKFHTRLWNFYDKREGDGKEVEREW